MSVAPPVHVFCWQIQKANHDAATKMGVKFGLVVDDMNEALGEVELDVKVGEVGRNAAPQSLSFRQVIDFLGIPCGSLFTAHDTV